jgi:hypothetical protein
MKINPDIILKALDSLGPAAACEAGVPLSELVTRVHTVCGIEVPAKAVRAACEAIEAEPPPATDEQAPHLQLLSRGRVRLITPARRVCRQRANDLAQFLGGTAVHWTDDRLSTVELTIPQARMLQMKLEKLETSTKDKK